MKKIDWKDVGKRAVKTFIQAGIASFSIDRLAEITDVESAKAIIYSMLIGSVAAGVSAVWNMIVNHFKK